MKKFRSILLALGLGASVLLAPAFPAAADEATEQSAEEETETETETETDTEDTAGDSSETLNLAASLDGVTLPENSEQVSYTYHGNVVQAARTSDGLTLLPVLQDDGSILWEVYDEDSDTAIPYHRFSSVSEEYVILPVPTDFEIPETFTEVQISIEGIVYDAWTSDTAGEEQLYFFYGQDGSGNVGLFRLDGQNGQVIRYVEDATVAPTDDPEMVSQISELESESAAASSEIAQYMAQSAAASSENASLADENSRTQMISLLVLIGAAAAVLILLLVIAIVASKLRKAKKNLRESEKKADELRNRAVSRRRYQASGEFSRPERTAARPADEEIEGDEGTSSVRHVRRSSQPSGERAERRPQQAAGSRPVRKGQAPQNRKPAGDGAGLQRQASDSVRRRSADAASGTGEVRRAAKPDAAAKRSSVSGETEKTVVTRRKPAASGEAVQETDKRAGSAAQDAAEAEADTVKTAAETADETAEMTQSAAQNTADASADTAANANGSFKIVKNKKVTKPMLEDLFDEDQDSADDDDGDFEVTDFKDV